KKQSFRAVQNMDSPAKANNNPPRKIFHHYRSGSPASGIPHRNEARFVESRKRPAYTEVYHSGYFAGTEIIFI
ncbi:MAG TPA: hypothetical protein VMD74_04625, partial [Candidatus Methylomirabilis sp.]|nr:hypothetical protein [Candidatus Methylomirabilis sp.]